MEFSRRIGDSRVASFEGTPDMISKFADVEITNIYLGSLRDKVARAEDEMGLRVAETPESVTVHIRRENNLGAGYYQP